MRHAEIVGVYDPQFRIPRIPEPLRQRFGRGLRIHRGGRSRERKKSYAHNFQYRCRNPEQKTQCCAAVVALGGFFTYVFSQLFISQNMCSTDSRPAYPCDSSGSSTKRTVAPCPFKALNNRSL